MYFNNHLYDRLTVCAVGRSWPEEFYDWIDDRQIRSIMQTVARETEEDYQILIALLNRLGVDVVRPTIDVDLDNVKESILKGSKIPPPPMFPGDCLVMAGNTFYESLMYGEHETAYRDMYKPIFDNVRQQQNCVLPAPDPSICAAMSFQFNDRIYYSIAAGQKHQTIAGHWQAIANKKTIGFHQHGHLDGWFCPATPGLIVTMADCERPQLLSLFYQTYFKDWKIVSRSASLERDMSFQIWQKQHSGCWWVPGQETNQKFIKFADLYFQNWFGNAAESVFELNMTVVDDRTVIIRESVDNTVTRELEQMGVTVYQTPFRHSLFWDGGLNCVTLPLHRQT